MEKGSQAQIVMSFGPTCSSTEILTEMFTHQADVVRFNCSWMTHDELRDRVTHVRNVAKDAGRPIVFMQDVPGPRVQEAHGHTYDHDASAFTDEDAAWLRVGAEIGMDYAALSFVGRADDILAARAVLKECGGTQKLIAKIERKVALEHLGAIIEAADAVMVARGDLGEELPLEEVPFAQARIVRRANEAGKPVIVATQMLLSMVEALSPTRAEVTDVANAILQGADAVMLSDETAKGAHPVETVAMMERIVHAAEAHMKSEGVSRHYHLL